MEKVYLTNSTGAFLKDANGRFLRSTLPSEYQALEYISNESTANIDTGVVATNKLFKIDLQFTSNATRQLMGISGSSSAYWGNNKGTWEKVGNSQGISTLTRCVVNYDVGNITASRVNTWIEGSTSKTVGTDSSFATAAAKTFKLFTLAGSSYNCIMRLYGMKVYNASGALLNVFVPCFRISDKVAGLYDLINHTFKYSTLCLIGNPDYELPPLYQHVEYIQSSGTQYINTGYDWQTDDTKVEADVMVTSNSSNQTLWGNEEYYSGSSRYFSGLPHGKNGSYSWYTGSGSVGTSQLTLNTRVQITTQTTSAKKLTVQHDGVTKLNNVNYTGTVQTGKNAGTKTENSGKIYIFCNHNSGSAGTTVSGHQQVGGMRVYSFKMYDNNKMVRWFVPCYRKTDNVIGLYDIVTATFFTNAGSGTFTKGSNIID